MRFFIPIAAATFAIAVPASAQVSPVVSPGPAAGPKAEDVKINQLIVYGEDACPKSTEDTVNVCARMPESERYRIPPDLHDDPADPARESWSRKVERLEMAGRTGIASCSPVGPGAGAGCLVQLIKQAQEERGGSDVNWSALVENARRERLGRIDDESEQIDRELREQGR